MVGYAHMQPLFLGFVFVFGTVIGSFLNAVIWRLRTRESFVKGRSYCPHCRHRLSPADLVPVASFLVLGGRCRYCRKPISYQYITVEIAVGLLFAVAAARLSDLYAPFYGLSFATALLRDWYFIAVLTIVFVFDLRYMMILRSVTLPATILAIAANLALGMPVTSLALGMIVGGGFFWLQYRLSRGTWIGGGDIALGTLMGAMLGFGGTLLALLVAYIVGAAFGLVLIALKKADGKTRLPFGTFLAAATALVMLQGEVIIRLLFPGL